MDRFLGLADNGFEGLERQRCFDLCNLYVKPNKVQNVCLYGLLYHRELPQDLENIWRGRYSFAQILQRFLLFPQGRTHFT
jgi:hypothetical protein